MNITIHAGHNPDGKVACGATGLIKESTVSREVVRQAIAMLGNAGITVEDTTVNDGKSATDILRKICAKCNSEKRDLNISIHFNACATKDHIGDNRTKGTEIWLYNQKSPLINLSNDILKGFEELGLKNRGVKYSTGLYVLKHSTAPTMLIECCFVDDMDDVKLYDPVKFARAISDAVIEWAGVKTNNPVDKAQNYVYNEDEIKTREQFIEFVGMVAQWDWHNTRRVLPSVTVAQALKESAFGTSELAENAKALFGIKLNGWTGEVYYKTATEQLKDGTYVEVPQTAWRKYSTWFDSIIDHNDYLCTRKVGNQSKPNWEKLIGCDDYILATQYLQNAQYAYATSHTYAQSLITDYIERYNLTVYDTVSYDRYCDICDMLFAENNPLTKAPDGMRYYVVFGEYDYKENAEKFSKTLTDAGIINRVVVRERTQ